MPTADSRIIEKILVEKALAEASIGCTSAFVAIASANFEQLVGFYGELLHQAAQPYQRDRYAEFQLPGLRLAIFKPKTDQVAQFAAHSSGAMSLCLEVTDLAGAIARLTHLGCAPPGPVLTASHGREVYAYDPDGNRLILHQGPAEPG
ncbi:glyoxalase [Nodosilinea sp. FACHB-131]|nr:glyoxalase [Nodosilinea sp. FACHB-131]